MIKAIETQYLGYRFRSRLEARWAVFFDALGLRWEYEPEGFELSDGTRYLPDFRVEYPGRDASERHFEWFEVKPDNRLSDHELHKLRMFVKEVAPITLLDGTPAHGMYVRFDGTGAEWDLTAPPEHRYGVALFSCKGRLWWDETSNFWGSQGFDLADCGLYEAVSAARSARFEHGECGGVAC